jgi:hypothetical protein
MQDIDQVSRSGRHVPLDLPYVGNPYLFSDIQESYLGVLQLGYLESILQSGASPGSCIHRTGFRLLCWAFLFAISDQMWLRDKEIYETGAS